MSTAALLTILANTATTLTKQKII